MVIGLFIPLAWHWHWPKLWPMIRGVIESAESEGATVYIFGDTTPSDHLDVSESSDFSAGSMEGVDGYIFAFPNATFLRYAEALHQRGFPVLLIGRRARNAPRVLCDNFAATRELVKTFVDRGHREIAFISGPAENLCAAERLRGYRQGLEDCRIEFDTTRVWPGDMSEQVARTATQQALAAGVKFSAVIATNDLTAIGAMDAVASAGLTVPDDVEVAGFDNVPRSHWSSPPLTTFDMQAYRLGYLSAQGLVRRVRGEECPAETLVQLPLVRRSSTRDQEDRQRFASAWTESAFFCERQIERLRRVPRACQLLQELSGRRVASPEFAHSLQRLLECAAKNGVGASSLYSLVGDAAKRGETDVAPIFEMLSAAAVDEQRKEIDVGIVFAAATLPLRELSFESVDEEVVIARLRTTLKELRVGRAGLFVRIQESATPFGTIDGRWWNLCEESPPRVASQPCWKELTEQPPRSSAFVILPLHYHGVQFGLLFLDASTPFLVHFPDLMGQLAAAMHGARMHSALARANRELDEARLEAESINEQLAKSYEALRSSEYFYHSLVESLPQFIVRKDPSGVFTYVNSAFAKAMNRTPEQIVGHDSASVYPPELAAKDRGDDLRVMESGQVLEFETSVEYAGKKRFLQVKKIPIFGERDECLGIQAVHWDVTVFRETEEQLLKTQRELVDASRLAGIAEMATGVLHNIGNVLNSVNTSANIAGDIARNSKIPNLLRVVEMLEQNRQRLPEFLTTDPRGSIVVDYLKRLSGHLHAEQVATVKEFDALREKIDHLNEIVAAQQGYANVAAVVESLPADELLELAIRLSDAALARHGVTLRREISPCRPVRVQRQKALQILVNLITNAKEALNYRVPGDRQIRIDVQPIDGAQVRISVSDNGEGIAPENLTRIFAFGFTTKKDGHGFGLHSCALAAKEMQGTLRAESSGIGKGATFSLELPTAEADS